MGTHTTLRVGFDMTNTFSNLDHRLPELDADRLGSPEPDRTPGSTQTKTTVTSVPKPNVRG
jgi:hypothetical protein